MKKVPLICLVVLFLAELCAGTAGANEQESSAWQQALPGWSYRFPEDHAIHPSFKTEWWYFTGNVQDERGKSFGYELTFFRQGVLPPGVREEAAGAGQLPSRFVQSDFKFAHFAISDLAGGKFYFTQKISRGAFGEAGFSTARESTKDGNAKGGAPLAWMESWSLQPQADGAWKITAKVAGETPMAIDLRVLPLKAPVIEGTDGVSQKAAALGNASHYYSFTRLQTTGALSLGSYGERTQRPRGKLVRPRVGKQPNGR